VSEIVLFLIVIGLVCLGAGKLTFAFVLRAERQELRARSNSEGRSLDAVMLQPEQRARFVCDNSQSVEA
jgi:hypothetical protein